MPVQVKHILARLRKPSVILSIVSQIASLLILIGYNINENTVMAAATIICSILVTLGIMSNPDTKKQGYTDDLLVCPVTGTKEKHVLVNGQLTCTDCGAVHGASKEDKATAVITAQDTR